MAMSKQAKNDAVVKAVAHPIRRAILRKLDGNTNGGVSPKALAQELGEQLPVVSYHMRQLAETGVVKLVDTAQRRGAIEHFYKRSGNALGKRAIEMLEFIGKD